MAIANSLQTYGDVNRREDVVMNMVELLTAQEDGIFSKLGKTTAIDEVHSFLTDTLATAASQAVEQSTDFTYLGRTTPTRLTNIVEEIAIPFIVSQKQQDVQHYSGENELQRQLAKAVKEWSNAAEFDLVRSTLVSGVSGTVAKMNGIINAISKSTNTSVQTSGTIFSATILDGMMNDNWTNSNGDVVTDIYIGGGLKQTVDTFTQKTNVAVNTPNGISSIVRVVTTFETSFGTVTFHLHRYVQQSGDATGRVLGIRPEKLKVAFLHRPDMITDLAKSGPYTPRALYGSLTVEVRNQDSNFFQSGFKKTL